MRYLVKLVRDRIPERLGQPGMLTYEPMQEAEGVEALEHLEHCLGQESHVLA